jgi:outer membrane lipoprotein carrier protein
MADDRLKRAALWRSRGPDRFRWDYRKPYQQVIVADGTAIWIYDSDLEQVTGAQARRTLSATQRCC